MAITQPPPHIKRLFRPKFVGVVPSSSGMPLFIRDSRGEMAASLCLNTSNYIPRGWGSHQYMKGGAELHDGWCAWFRQNIGEQTDGYLVERMLNEAWETSLLGSG